jgi:PadR family transcriptional regulator PadR
MEPVARTREEVARPTAPSPFTPSNPAARPVDTFLGNWIVQARKGLLELSVLTALEDCERYGYEIVRDMAARPALGGAEGTVYPMLARLEDRGLLRTTLRDSGHGPTRKYYALTADGRFALEDMRARFRELISGVLREDDGELPPQGARIALRRVAR